MGILGQEHLDGDRQNWNINENIFYLSSNWVRVEQFHADQIAHEFAKNKNWAFDYWDACTVFKIVRKFKNDKSWNDDKSE